MEEGFFRFLRFLKHDSVTVDGDIDPRTALCSPENRSRDSVSDLVVAPDEHIYPDRVLCILDTFYDIGKRIFAIDKQGKIGVCVMSIS
jgi:hypothetical protein